MSIELQKERAEKIGIILAKANITKVPPIRVGLALDTSGSIKDLYIKGTIQETVDRLLAVSLKFDDNGELDMWHFSDHFDRLETAKQDDFGKYVKKEILENSDISLWGGTSYGPVIEDMINFWFPHAGLTLARKPAEKKHGWNLWPFSTNKAEEVLTETLSDTLSDLEKLPAMGLLVTDGENGDKSFTEEVLIRSKDKNVYWQMVGVGDAHHFQFLEKMADDLPNVGFVNLASLKITDDQLYGSLIAEEFIGWIKKISA